MSTDPRALDQLERRLGRLFFFGLTVSASALVAGLVLFFMMPGAPATNWMLNAGLICLMATPILRVLVSVAEYIRMRDWFFVLTTIVVLIELSVTVFYALRQS